MKKISLTHSCILVLFLNAFLSFTPIVVIKNQLYLKKLACPVSVYIINKTNNTTSPTIIDGALVQPDYADGSIVGDQFYDIQPGATVNKDYANGEKIRSLCLMFESNARGYMKVYRKLSTESTFRLVFCTPVNGPFDYCWGEPSPTCGVTYRVIYENKGC